MLTELRSQLKSKLDQHRSKVSVAASRDLTAEERSEVDALKAEIDGLKGRIAVLEDGEASAEEVASLERALPRRTATPSAEPDNTPFETRRAPAVHAKKHRFSVTRAIDRLASGKPLNGIEAEVTREIAVRSGKETDGVFLPWGAEYRDLDLSGGAGAIATWMDDSVIDYLRKKTILGKVGATFLTDLDPGKFAMPKQTGIGTGYFVSETGTPTESSQTIGQVLFDPKTVAAWTEYTFSLTKQSSVSIDKFVEDDLRKSIATKIEEVAVNGGGSNEPTGAFQNSSLNAVAIGTHGGALTWSHLVQMEREVYADNADTDSMYYIGTPGVMQALKTTPKISGQPVYLMESGSVNGYQFFPSNMVPATFTKGTGTNLHGVLFGDFSTIHVALWGAPEVVVDPYTAAPTKTKVHVRQAVDVQLRHPESLCKISDVLVS